MLWLCPYFPTIVYPRGPVGLYGFTIDGFIVNLDDKRQVLALPFDKFP